MNLEPNNWGLTPNAKGRQQNASNLSKGSDLNWLGSAGEQYGCKPMSACVAEHDALQGCNDMAWRAVA
jgi:hypothetical protein